jgi:hypothetical protein
MLQFNNTGVHFWRVYLHEKGHFFPGIGQFLGSTCVLSNTERNSGDPPPTEKHSVLEMQVYDRTYMDFEDARCLPDVDNNDWNVCYNQYLEKQIGCTLRFHGHVNKTDSSSCDNNDQVRLFPKIHVIKIVFHLPIVPFAPHN